MKNREKSLITEPEKRALTANFEQQCSPDKKKEDMEARRDRINPSRVSYQNWVDNGR